MIEFVETELNKLATEMNEETPEEGTSINDLILAADTADDKVVFDEVDPSLVEAMKEPEPKESPITITVEVVEEAKPHTVPVEIVVVPEVKVESPVANIFANEAEHRATPDYETMCDITNFRPTINLIGGGRGYYCLPWSSIISTNFSQ